MAILYGILIVDLANIHFHILGIIILIDEAECLYEFRSLNAYAALVAPEASILFMFPKKNLLSVVS